MFARVPCERRAGSRSSNLHPPFRPWRAGRHHRSIDAIAPTLVDLKPPRVQRARIAASNLRRDESHRDDIRATFSGRGKFQPSFFLPLFGPGKIPGEAFFLPLFRGTLPAWGMLGVRCPPPLVWGL